MSHSAAEYALENGGCYDGEGKLIATFAHRRLSIIDLTDEAAQPMLSVDGRYLLVFNGELYNYVELREELLSAGATFRSVSDTEVLLASWEKWGIDCLSRFIGMWAFCIYDSIEKVAWLARDRFGIKPLYYSIDKKTLRFASECKALLRESGRGAKLEHSAAAQFLFYSSTFNPSGLLFSEIEEVPQGTVLRYDLVTADLKNYHYYTFGNINPEVSESLSEEEANATFGELLNASIRLHKRADVPVGVCLSGGLDSSYIASFLASQYSDVSLKSFTAGYSIDTVDESRLAALVRDRYPAIQSTVVYPEMDQTWESLDKQIYHHDLPFHSSSMFAQWEVMRSVQERGIKVVMNGQGSDELLGGYYNFTGQYLVSLLVGFRWLRFMHEARELKKGFTSHLRDDMQRAFYNYLPSVLRSAIRKQKRIGAGLLKPALVALLESDFPGAEYRKTFHGLAVESVKYGLQQLLRYEDRISMAFSIESRVPFLDHRFAEHVLRMKPEWLIKNGFTKYPLRQLGAGLVPDEIRWRRDKMGFLTPAGRWLVEKRNDILEFMHSSRIRSLIDVESYNRLIGQDMNQPTHVSEAWKLFIFAKWLEIYDVSV